MGPNEEMSISTVGGVSSDGAEATGPTNPEEHLLRVIQAFRKVTHLAVRATGSQALLDGLCLALVETRGYAAAMVLANSEEGGPPALHHAGLGQRAEVLGEALNSGWYPKCFEGLVPGAPSATRVEPQQVCPGCPVEATCPGRENLRVALASHGKVYGALGVSLDTGLGSDREERILLAELADEVALAVRSLRERSRRKEAEEARALSDELFKTAFQEGSLGRVLTRPGGGLIRVNRRMCEMLGRTQDDLLTRTWADITHPEDRAASAQLVQRLLSGQMRSDRLEKRYVRKDGSDFWAEVSTTLLRDQTGMPLCFVTDIQDISERHRAEAEVRSLLSAARAVLVQRSFLETAGNVFAICKHALGAMAGYVALLNSSGVENEVVLLDPGASTCNVDPSLPMPIRGLREKAYREATVVFENDFAASPWAALLPKGHARLDSVLLAPIIEDSKVVGLLGLANKPGGFNTRDARLAGAFGELLSIALTSHRSLQRLEESEQRFRGTLESLPLISLVLDPQGNVTFCNEFLLQLTGWSQEEVLGNSWFDRFLPESCREEVRTMFLESIKLEDSLPVHFENPIITRRGELRHIRWTNSVRRDTSGHMHSSTALGEDITERRKEDEHRLKLEEQLRLAQKMEAVGRLAGGVAHDFNNIVSVIMNYADLITDSLHEQDPIRSDLGEIQKAAHRASDLTRRLLAFSRTHLANTAVHDLNVVVEGIHKMLRRFLREDMELQLELAPQPVWASLDLGQMEQVLVNLVVNARDALGTGGRITIRTGESGNSGSAGRDGEERWSVISVSDNGTGMTAEVLAHLFEPFFTTKPADKGTGLGLSTVYGIVKQAGGVVRVSSALGEGSEFKVCLPQAQPPDFSGETASAQPTPTARRATILVVEDEAAVRAITVRVLRSSGHRVLEAATPTEALGLFETHSDTIDLLLTDVVMPHMSGPELAEHLLLLRPTLRVLFMSGYVGDASLMEQILATHHPFLSKPFGAPELTRKVRETLEG